MIVRLLIPEKLRLKLPEPDAWKLYNFLRLDGDFVKLSNDWGVDIIAFRIRNGNVVLYAPMEHEHKLIELDTFEEIMLRDLLEFALNRREAVV